MPFKIFWGPTVKILKKSFHPSFCYKFLKFWQKTSHFAKSAKKSAKNG